MDQNQMWKVALGQLELRVSQGNFLTWFRDTRIKEIKKGIAVIETPSAFAHEWLSRKYRNPILTILKDLDSSVEDVSFCIHSQTQESIGITPERRTPNIVAQKVPRPTPVPVTKKVAATPITAPVNKTLNSRYTFDSFVTGSNNEVAYAACRAVVGKPGELYNPLFIYGGVGLGKTHLLHAIGNEILIRTPSRRVLYVSSETFINDFVQSIRERNTQWFKDKYRDVDVLMIDDLQFLAGKAKTQEELFHTYNTLHSEGKQLIMSSDRSPKAIPTLEERLRSRLTGGMLVDIQQPSYETRLAILQEKAVATGVVFDQDALAFIAKNIQKNVRELEGALKRVVAHCELNKEKASLAYTERVLESILDQPQQRAVDSGKIIEVVGLYYNLSQSEMCGKSRKQEIVRPRQIAMYLLRQENRTSFPSIGDLFGGRDHTTAMYACEKIGKLLEHDEGLVQDLNFIKERLYA